MISTQQQWNPSTASRERMALPPIAMTAPPTSASAPPAPTFPPAHTPVMVMMAAPRPMMSPSLAMSPYGHATTCSPSISKKRIRAVPNATRSITLDMLRPHFDRPLAEVAGMFGICMTLMKKICRKNGVPRWPHRQIRGLRKSIWSIEKALRSCESEAQRQSYLDHLEKQKEKLTAILRGPDGSGRGIFHELVMSVPCSPMSDLATPKAATPIIETSGFSMVTTVGRSPASMMTMSSRPPMSPSAPSGMLRGMCPPPRMPTPPATSECQTPTISRLPSIASLLAAHKSATPTHAPTPATHYFQC
ncbi:hypothetical protein ATCC90586_008447 [Pythium insidiosum]|nr:hypothetical protein ATCC90586_008447 [Pythium insidiosum]